MSFTISLSEILEEFVDFSQRNIFNMGLTGFMSYLFVSMMVGLYIRWYISDKDRYRNAIRKGKRILIVISHPDDECMFFAPTIIKLIKEEKRVFLLCLSRGNYLGLGDLRMKELAKSCDKLGIPSHHLLRMCAPSLNDDPNEKWNEDRIIEIVLNYVRKMQIQRIVTFDEFGVSGHPNHTAIYYAMKRMMERDALPKRCKVFCLDSVNVLRKYTSTFDAWISFFFHSNMFVLSASEYTSVKAAMWAHKSQLVWYRILYILSSRYCYVNTFKPMFFAPIYNRPEKEEPKVIKE